jgi:hypothetical protein
MADDLMGQAEMRPAGGTCGLAAADLRNAPPGQSRAAPSPPAGCDGSPACPLPSRELAIVTAAAGPVPLENRIRLLACVFVVA